MDLLDATASFIDEEATAFARSVGGFFEQNVKASDVARWRQQHFVDRDLWTKAGAAGLLGVSVPTDFGGGGGDFSPRRDHCRGIRGPRNRRVWHLAA